jgi:hypothetical protein
MVVVVLVMSVAPLNSILIFFCGVGALKSI